MKKAVLFAIFCFMIGNIWAQSEERSILKVNPLSALIGTGSLFYEQKIDDQHSWQIGFAYMGLRIDNTHFSGLAITPEYRIYVKKRSLSGFYVGPYLRYQNYAVTSDNDKGTYTSFGGGVLFGRQLIYKSGFILDMFAGPSYNSGRTKYTSGNGTTNEPGMGIDGFGLRIGMAIGFGF
ncbi:MAG: DUF3575 domain-containing protein [Bacteroidetes bacterium]|nr:DUF3575 domain-containing protein [Bacteroidota bacterium]